MNQVVKSKIGLSNQKAIEDQYAKPNLFQDIIDGLIDKGINLGQVSIADLSSVDEFHIRGLEVSHELASSICLCGKKVLDMGCGLGGPCRLLAERYNCDSYGIDLNLDYVETAKRLSKLVNRDKVAKFFHGDVLNLPFEDESFDVVWTQHVQMNIKDKRRFYNEINRVLAKGGSFIYYDVFKQNSFEINYPVPWANDSSLSFLQSIAEMESLLNELNFSKQKNHDQTDKGLEFLEDLVDSGKLSNPDSFGLNLLLGSKTEEKLKNVLEALKSSRIELQSGVYLKS